MLVNSGGNATQPRAPGHDRPPAAQRAAGHGRLSADSGAPGADVPLAITAGAPGQYCLSAALQAPGDDLPLATTAGAPGQHRLSAASIATAPVPAGLRRLRQGCLPRVPANPRTLIYPLSHQDTAAHNRAASSHAPTYPQSRSTASSFSRQETGVKSSFPRKRESINRPSQVGSDGATYPQSRSTTYQVHPAVQVPPHPRSCSTACTGLLLRPPSRAPPAPCSSFPRKRESTPSPPCGEGAGG